MRRPTALAAVVFVGWTLASPSAFAQTRAAALAATNQTLENDTRPVADRALAAAKLGDEAFSPFGAREVLSKARLGPALPVYFVRLDRLREYSAGSDPLQLLEPPASVIYPVIVGSGASSLIEVSRIKPGAPWAVTTRGRPVLASALAERAAAANTGLHQQFCVWVGALDQRFYGALQGDTLFLTPLEDAGRFQLRRGAPLPATDVFLLLRAAARELKDEGPGRYYPAPSAASSASGTNRIR